jgi:hypothetical protein
MRLLATNYKLEKSVPGFKLIGLSLAPHTVAGGPTVCKFSTAECRAVCLGTETGLNVLQSAINAKIERTKLWQDDPEAFKAQLATEVHAARKSAHKAGLKLAVRLNVYSDIPWELEFPELFYAYDDVQFYDYTKVPGRLERPRNYHLTYSYTGTNASKTTASEYLRVGTNTAVIFPAEPPPWFEPPWPATGFLPVVNGDLNDYRPADPTPAIVGLKFKGPKTNLLQIKKFVQGAVSP